jgi:hypothetical protein
MPVLKFQPVLGGCLSILSSALTVGADLLLGMYCLSSFYDFHSILLTGQQTSQENNQFI